MKRNWRPTKIAEKIPADNRPMITFSHDLVKRFPKSTEKMACIYTRNVKQDLVKLELLIDFLKSYYSDTEL